MNDLDFIKNKFEESGISAPEELNKENITEKLNNVERKKPKRKKAVVSAAACAAVLLTAAIGANMIIGGFSRVPVKKLKTNKGKITFFESRGEVIKALKSIKSSESTEDLAAGGAVISKKSYDIGVNYSASGSTSYQSSAYSQTYKQVEGVDEADIVKTDGKYIYLVDDTLSKKFSRQRVFIYNTVPATKYNESKSRPEPELEAEVKIDRDKKKYADIQVRDIFIYEDYLIANISLYDKKYKSSTASYVYDISDMKNIKKTADFVQSGDYISSRIVGDKLYIVSNDERYSNTLPKAGKESTPDELPAKYICCPEKPTSKTFLVVSSMDLAAKKHETVTKAVLGAADTIYCSGDTLYAVAERYENMERFYGVITDSEFPRRLPTTSQLIKFDLKNGIKPVASVKLKGSVKDNYSLDEKDGYLRVAANYEGKTAIENKMYVFDNKMNLVGETKPFGKDEHIQAVKYVGSTAYVITYEETDPLFVIDLSDVKAPKILGSVKISGFSTMLVPINDNRLLGIGYSKSDYVKLVLFDVSNPTEPKVLDKHVVKYTYSDVQDEPKAFVYNPERDCYTIPVCDYEAFSGSYTFNIKNDKINELDFYTPEGMEYCSRCVYIGDNLYLVDCEKPMIAVREYKN